MLAGDGVMDGVGDGSLNIFHGGIHPKKKYLNVFRKDEGKAGVYPCLVIA